MKSIIILYHKNCPDGFGAAWAAWKKFGAKAEYIAVEPRTLPSHELKNKEIYVLDNSYSKEVQTQLRQNNKKVVIIDHHESSQEDVQYFSENMFNNNHSGAVLSWQYFFPNKRVPELLQYIEDGDLWRFKLPKSKIITTYCYSYPFDFKIWNALTKEVETAKGRKNVLEKGEAITRYKDTLIGEVIQKAQLVKFENIKTLAVNSSAKRINSGIGHVLYEKMPPISIVWHIGKDSIHISLRSNGKIDVAKLAQQYGGGGHEQAAGFELPLDAQLPWKTIKER